MDELVSFLEGPRATDAFLLRVLLDPPWALRIQDEAPLTVVAMTRGSAWIRFDGDEEATAFGAGDVLVIRGPDPYVVAHDLADPPSIVIQPHRRATTAAGEEIEDRLNLGVRTWGTDPEGASAMLVGAYESGGEIGRRLLDSLPRLVVVRGDRADRSVVDLLTREITRELPAQEVVLDRLLDLLLVSTLRTALADQGEDGPAWYRAAADPVVGEAVRLLQHQPAEPWSVASLAAAVGVSRAGLARRFHELVGEPPITFLTGWRMALAADLLADPAATVGGVAAKVGYRSPFTFSTAFKRTYGCSPRAWRDQGGAAR